MTFSRSTQQPWINIAESPSSRTTLRLILRLMHLGGFRFYRFVKEEVGSSNVATSSLIYASSLRHLWVVPRTRPPVYTIPVCCLVRFARCNQRQRCGHLSTRLCTQSDQFHFDEPARLNPVKCRETYSCFADIPRDQVSVMCTILLATDLNRSGYRAANRVERRVRTSTSFVAIRRRLAATRQRSNSDLVLQR